MSQSRNMKAIGVIYRYLTCCIPQRIVLSIMCFLAVVNAYTMRMVLSMAITKMVINHYDDDIKLDGHCPVDDYDSQGEHDGGEYDWSENLQGIILSAFFYGYIITHIPGGIISQKYGGKWCLSLGILSTSIFTILTPIAVQYGGSTALIVLRFLEGLGEGTTFPALSTLLACWVPPSERSKLGSLVFGGTQIGNIMGLLISGQLLHTFHWSSVFYFFGGLGIIWFIIFTLICSNNPESHPFISNAEKEYLQREIGALKRDENTPATPWVAIVTNVPLIALVISQIGHDWGYFIMNTELPKYMSDVLHFSIKTNGLYSSLPYAVMWIVSLASGGLGDWLIKRNIMTTTNIRKMFTTIASVGPSIFMMMASYSGCSQSLSIIYFTVAMAFMGTYYAGTRVNLFDLSPNYAGTLMGIINGLGALSGAITPTVIGALTPTRSLNEWRVVFWIAFVIFTVTNIVYLIWASAEVQPFNDPQKKNVTEDAIDMPSYTNDDGKIISK